MRTGLITLLSFTIATFSFADSSLDFANTTTNRVDCGSLSSINDLTTLTVMAWIFPDASADDIIDRIYSKQPKFMAESNLIGANGIRAQVNRATTNADCNAIDNTLVVSQWQFIVMTYSEADGCRVYWGDQDTAMAEVTYDPDDLRTVGSGATSVDNASTLAWGNRGSDSPAGTNSFDGKIGSVGYWNRVLTLAEMEEQRFHPYPTSGCVDFHYLGFNGTGSQRDLSGNGNHGSVTGAAGSSAGPPIFIQGGPL